MTTLVFMAVFVLTLAFLGLILWIAPKRGWFDKIGTGITVEVRPTDGGYGTFVTGFEPDSPARDVIDVGNQILAVDDTLLIGDSAVTVQKLDERLLEPKGSHVTLIVKRQHGARNYDVPIVHLHSHLHSAA